MGLEKDHWQRSSKRHHDIIAITRQSEVALGKTVNPAHRLHKAWCIMDASLCPHFPSG
jgi:hypothetical protein